MKTMTAKEFGIQHNVDYQLAISLLKLLALSGHVKSAGVRPNPAGRGKGSNLYEVPEKVDLDLTKPLVKVA